MRLLKLIPVFTLVLCTPILFMQCGIYSLSGADLHPDIKSFTVIPFSNQASIVVPSLADDLTEQLKDKFRNEMNLTHTNSDGDIIFEGTITNYKTGPSSVSSGEIATTTRLIISVKVVYENKMNTDQNFSVNFSNYIDYDSNEDLSAIEDELITEISEMLIQDIFNRAVNNW